MNRLLSIIFLTFCLLFFVGSVRAACTVEPGADFCPTPTTCEPTWKFVCEGVTQTNICPPNQHLTPNGGCQDNGTGAACDCGVNAQGACKSCGGGGSSCVGGVNCPSGWTPAWHQPSYSDYCDQSSPTTCSLGSAQQYGECCTAGCARRIVTTYNCCPPGSSDQVTTTDNGQYTVLQQPSLMNSCSDWLGEAIDQFISNSQSNTVYRTYRYCDGTENPDTNKCDGSWVWVTEYYYNVTCEDIVNTWSCKSVCTSTAPSGLNIVQGASASVANLSWTPGNGGSAQKLYVDQSQTEVNNGCTTPNACEVPGATLSSSANSYIVTGLAPSTTYYFRITTYENASCNTGIVGSYTTPAVSLSGRVYLDNNNDCSTATPWSLGGLTVSAQNTNYSGSVGSDGRFGFYGGTSSPISLVLTGYSSAYFPSTAPGCNAGSILTSVNNPSSTNYFYLTPSREPWWQVIGGSIYSASNVRSETPNSDAHLIEAGAGGAIGALLRASGSLDVGNGSVSTPGYSTLTKYRGKTMGYDFFAAQMGLTRNYASDWTTDVIDKPNYDSLSPKDFYYAKPTSATITITSPWVVPRGEKFIVFVNGDLRIDNNITVADGGFLAMIVKGKITVDPLVSDIQGLYVIDGTFSTESQFVQNVSNDIQLKVEGSVVAWGGVSLARDLSALNVTNPGEKFTYRPDLLVNMPNKMKVFALRWQEVAPGTFGN